ncbi:MAG: CHAP domain-containing protein [Bulleidia sp.]
MQISNFVRVKAGRLILPILMIGTVLRIAIPGTDVSADDTLGANVPVFELSTSDSNPITTLKNAVISDRAENDPNIDMDAVDMARSTIDIDGFNSAKTGIQSVKVKVNLARKASETESYQDSVGYSFIEDAVIKMTVDAAPKIALTGNSITVNNGDTFNPESFIIYVTDDSGNLPALKIDSNVDMSTDGTYSVTYTAVDQIGNSVSKVLEVNVKTPQEVLDAIAAEEEARRLAEEEAQRKAAEEEEKKRQEELQRVSADYPGGVPIVGNGIDPYAGGTSNCTDTAWLLAYEAGHVLPNWGNAYAWLYNAQATGYATGYLPAVGSIAVYSNHVAYVAAVDGDRVYIKEGGYNGHYMERWVSATSEGTQSLQGYVYLN